MPLTAPIMVDVIEEHLDEAAFLWARWRAACESFDHLPHEVATGCERRLIAQIDALALAPAPMLLGFFEKALAEDDSGKIFVCALALFENARADVGETRAAVDVMSDRVRTPNTALLVAQALWLCRRPALVAALTRWIERDAAMWHAAALCVYGVRANEISDWRPPSSLFFSLLAADECPEVRGAALFAARRAADAAVRAAVEAAFDGPDVVVRDAALKTGLVLGAPAAYFAARRLVAGSAPSLGVPLGVLAMSGEPADLDLIAGAWSRRDATTPDAAVFWALGRSGWPGAADLLARYLAEIDCRASAAADLAARAAGEGFCAITGLALAPPFTLTPAPAPEEPIAFAEEDLTADLTPPPESVLPLPDGEMIARWWRGARARFSPATRYLAGVPLDAAAVSRALDGEVMRRRPPLALEVAVRSKGARQPQTCTWVFAQRAALARTDGARGLDFNQPLARALEDRS